MEAYYWIAAIVLLALTFASVVGCIVWMWKKTDAKTRQNIRLSSQIKSLQNEIQILQSRLVEFDGLGAQHEVVSRAYQSSKEIIEGLKKEIDTLRNPLPPLKAISDKPFNEEGQAFDSSEVELGVFNATEVAVKEEVPDFSFTR